MFSLISFFSFTFLTFLIVLFGKIQRALPQPLQPLSPSSLPFLRFFHWKSSINVSLSTTVYMYTTFALQHSTNVRRVIIGENAGIAQRCSHFAVNLCVHTGRNVKVIHQTQQILMRTSFSRTETKVLVC